jgi:hypothetical protein
MTRETGAAVSTHSTHSLGRIRQYEGGSSNCLTLRVFFKI